MFDKSHQIISEFTFHYVSIKSTAMAIWLGKQYLFTFHYVSIKSLSKLHCNNSYLDLHSTMYLLNHTTAQTQKILDANLHSTMYLLNQVDDAHNYAEKYDLHSTMYLLNPKTEGLAVYHRGIYIPLCIY